MTDVIMTTLNMTGKEPSYSSVHLSFEMGTQIFFFYLVESCNDPFSVFKFELKQYFVFFMDIFVQILS